MPAMATTMRARGHADGGGQHDQPDLVGADQCAQRLRDLRDGHAELTPRDALVPRWPCR